MKHKIPEINVEGIEGDIEKFCGQTVRATGLVQNLKKGSLWLEFPTKKCWYGEISHGRTPVYIEYSTLLSLMRKTPKFLEESFMTRKTITIEGKVVKYVNLTGNDSRWGIRIDRAY